MTPAEDSLVDVLAEIAEIEARPGYVGPKIMQVIYKTFDAWPFFSLNDCVMTNPGQDTIFGEIVRAVKIRLTPDNHIENWMIDIEDGGDGEFVVLIKDRIGRKIGVGQGPIALAAARAYLEAIGGRRMIYTLKLIRQADGDPPDEQECRISQSTYLEIEKMFAAEFHFGREIRKIRDEYAVIGGETE